MMLSTLLEKVDSLATTGDLGVSVAGVVADSRQVAPGHVFVAIAGNNVDAYRYVDDAVRAGAIAVVSERDLAVSASTIRVRDSRRALAAMAATWNGNPADRIESVGATGTNGKTSVTHLVHAILSCGGWNNPGLVGTLGIRFGDTQIDTGLTTPDPLVLHKNLQAMVMAGSSGVVMEVSSHAVRQHRTWGIDFRVGILTNVTHDHLDYHSSWEDYRDAKRAFCDNLIAVHREQPGVLVYWDDDPAASEIGRAHQGPSVSVGTGTHCDVRVVHSSMGLRSTEVVLAVGDEQVAVDMQLLGVYVATNSALAAGAAHALGIGAQDIAAGLQGLARIPGRFEAIVADGKPTVIIDYCHTPDAVERVLQGCRDLGPDRVLAVFGCGGDRDREKRPLMGAAVQRLADRSFVTTDNPRTESIDQIVDDIMRGIDSQANPVDIELDRATAIASAIKSARANDVVALLGKGHETYQIIGKNKHPFSDRDTAEQELQRWSAR